MEFRGLDLTSPINRLKAGFAALSVNVRRYLAGGFALRNPLSGALYTLSAAVQSIARMNDATANGPVSGYIVISVDEAGNVYNGATKLISGLSGNKVSLQPFQPNQSVQPWMYLADSSESAAIATYGSLTPTLTPSSSTWTNPANATSSTLYASCPGVINDFLYLSYSAVSLPLGAVITGLTVSGNAYANLASLAMTVSVGSSNQNFSMGVVPAQFSVGSPVFLWGLTSSIIAAGLEITIYPETTSGVSNFLNSAVVTIYYVIPNSFTCAGMLKMRSDGLARKMGIMEPQAPPIVGINTVNVTQWLTLPATSPPWTNIGGVNADYNYSGSDTQPPYPATISTPVVGSTVTLTVTGTATVNGLSHAPGDSGPSSAGYPGDFIATPKIVVFAFTDANGNIVAVTTGGVPPVVGNVGAGAVLTVPPGAVQLQIGIDSQGGHFAANSGSYLVEAVVSTSSITQVSSIVGLVTAYIWGDSPSGGAVATYLWKNPNDGGTGIARTIGTAQASSSNNSLIMDSTPEDGTVPVLWSTLNSAGSTVGTIDLFAPSLESAGYQDFNACVVGSLFVPAGGTYNFQINNKDQIMFGVGGGATSTGGTVYGPQGQSITVANGLPLLFVSAIDGEGGQQTNTFTVTFPEQGIYPFEIDWDYWYHPGRSLIVEMGPTAGAAVALIPPLPQGVRTGVQYWGKYRAAETGAQSNPSPPSPIQQTPVLANTVTMPYSTDPQVTKCDYYRQDEGLPNPTYVGTGPNDGLGGTINGIVYNTPIEDTLTDLAADGNQIMAEDDFEPFPSIDTPKSGVVTIVAGVVTWLSGDQFNTRWLPGTLMLIGFPTQAAYSLVARPISTTQIVIPDVPDTIGTAGGAGVAYNIAQPILAQTAVPYLWGPTDNIPFMCGCTGLDGVVRWCKGNNLDSAPDTNQQNLTDPSEIIVNGAMSGGYGIVFSIKRAWVQEPNFFNAQATATGTSGSTWSFRSTEISRGLFIPRCLAVEGSGKTFFRVDDGIHFSQGGQGSQSITDETLYPLFSHEGSTPVAIVRNGATISPPDDTQPQLQQFSIVDNWLYYDYMGIDAAYHTLTFDINAMAWVWDVTTPSATCHASNQGPSAQGVLVGCSDSTVRQFSNSGTETVNGQVVTSAIGGVGWEHLYQITVEYASNAPVTLSFIAADAGNGSYASNPLTLPSTGGAATKYTTKVSPNKWKWLQFSFASTDLTLHVYLDGFVVNTRSWGDTGPYAAVQPFAPSGGGGGQA